MYERKRGAQRAETGIWTCEYRALFLSGLTTATDLGSCAPLPTSLRGPSSPAVAWSSKTIVRSETVEAHAALDLRTRQDDEVPAEPRRNHPRTPLCSNKCRCCVGSCRRIDAAGPEMPMNQRRGAIYTCGTEIGWYLGSRSWRVDRRHWQGPCCRTAGGAARQDTRRALRALERWFERAWRRHQQAQQRIEQRELDEMGALRYVARSRAHGRSEVEIQPVGNSGTEAAATSTASLTDRSELL